MQVQNNSTSNDNRILTEAIPSLFLRYAVPAIIGLVAASSAGVIDGIFVGNYVGANALAALNLTLPIGALYFGLSLMLAIGGMVMAGKYMGQQNYAAASGIFSKTTIVMVVLSLFLCTLTMFFIDQVIALLGANEELTPLTRSYLAIFLPFEPLLVIAFSLSYFVRVDGRPNLASASLILSALVNIALDWLLIVRLNWGVEGAAWATGISYVVMLSIVLPHFFSKHCRLRFSLRQKQWGEVRRASINGISEFVNEMSAGVTAFIFNWVMITRLGSEGVAALAVVNYILFVGLMIVYAISDSLQPLISTNLGARRADRISSLMKISSVTILTIGCSIIVLLLSSPDAFMRLFLTPESSNVLRITGEFIAGFWPAFLFNGVNIAFSAYFTAMHKPYHSAAIALCRSLALPLIFLFTLPHWLGDMGVYISIPIAEMLTLLLAVSLYTTNRPHLLVEQEQPPLPIEHEQLAN